MNFKEDEKKDSKKKESDMISWADATEYDLEVQNQGLHLPLANSFWMMNLYNNLTVCGLAIWLGMFFRTAWRDGLTQRLT